MDLNVFWTFTAQEDREGIYKYWNDKSGDKDYSRVLNNIISDKLLKTVIFPDSGLETNRKDIYVHVIEKYYKLFYKVEENSIIVLRFWVNNKHLSRLKTDE